MPSPAPKTKMSLAQLQEIIEKQSVAIKQLKEDADRKDNVIKTLQNKLLYLESEMCKNNSLLLVRERVTEELRDQLVNLQQYTRRPSAIIAGINKKEKETHNDLLKEVTEIINEVDSSTTLADVDKFHRVGPLKERKQDIVIRFKTHDAKEQFFLRRKNIKRAGVKIRPSLAPARRELIKEAIELLDNCENRDYQLTNPPHFVYADMHGNLKVKMSKEINGKLFFNFSSIVDLNGIIDRCQQNDLNSSILLFNLDENNHQ